MKTIKIELLSPAKNLEVGMAAINHGADAVYIGGPSFGAREVESIIERIKVSPEWLESVTRQGEEKGVSLEQSLRDNADYAYRMTIEPKGFVR